MSDNWPFPPPEGPTPWTPEREHAYQRALRKQQREEEKQQQQQAPEAPF